MMLRFSAGLVACWSGAALISAAYLCPAEAFSSPSAFQSPASLRAAVVNSNPRKSKRDTPVSFGSFWNPNHLDSHSALFSSVSDGSKSKPDNAATDGDDNAVDQEDFTAVLKQTFESTETNMLLGQPIPYNEMTIGVMKETYKGENRVSLSPDAVALLTKAGLDVVVESGGK